jgi:hypothetical protein
MSPDWPNCLSGTLAPSAEDRGRGQPVPAVSESDPLHAVFVHLILYGLRRGESSGFAGKTSTSKPEPFASNSKSSV